MDDDPDVLEATAGYLEATFSGVRVLRAPDGIHALEEIAVQSVDLILTDYRMPNMDGLELLQAVRQRSPHTRCMMMTAQPGLELAMRAVNEQGVSCFLQKPVVPQDLVEGVAGALGMQA